jgi:pimeloyl-ACP methyl ester carboxylesterase
MKQDVPWLKRLRHAANKAATRIPLALPLLISGCVGYAEISETQPTFRPTQRNSGKIASAENGISGALKLQMKEPRAAIGDLLVATREASDHLKDHPEDPAARDTYNFAVSRVFGVLKRSHLDPWSAPLAIPSPHGPLTLSHAPDPRPNRHPGLYDFTPADGFHLKGSYVTHRTTRAGIGAPLVAVGRHANDRAREDFTIPRIYYGVTALIQFNGNRAIVSFEDPLAVEEVRFAGHVQPLAADFTVPLAVMLASTQPRKLEIARLLRPDEYAGTARIARLQPYDPDKTVVLVIHGLMDSPATWTPMINTLRGDPEIRKRYQFWFYSYPSGYPYPHSAAILRHELDAIQARYPLKRKMVVIGHSMGGCISRVLITDSGDRIWQSTFKKSPQEVHLSEQSRKLITDALIFKHRPEIGRVIFVSAPLKGSNLANRWFGRFGSWLIKSPANLLIAGTEALKTITFTDSDLHLNRIPASIDTLSPNNRFVRAINTVPIAKGVPYHTIIGDRGKGNSPDSSDGVVPYWSSHMDGAVSEKIVPSGHSAHQNPEAIEEVRRILLAHPAGGRNTPSSKKP